MRTFYTRLTREVGRRIQFLEDGLTHLEATRRLLLEADEETRHDGVTEEQIRKMYEDLQELRRKLTKHH